MPNIEEILYDKTGFLYSELEKEIPFWEKECMNDRDDLSIFKAQCGVNFPTNANDGIVFYGRATNGWNPNKPLKMNMLKDYSGSPFFALMKAIAEHFYSTDWNNRVAWSNICKVAPMEKKQSTSQTVVLPIPIYGRYSK